MSTVQSLTRSNQSDTASLLCVALADPDPGVRRAAADALGKLRHLPALRRLEKMADNPALNPEEVLTERLVAISAIGEIGSVQAVDSLLGILSHRAWFRRAASDRVRAAAARALAKTGDPNVAELLLPFASDRRPAVRTACQEALESLKSRPSPPAQKA